MARLNCKCGHSTRLTGDTENEFFLLSSAYLDELTEKLDNKHFSGDELNTYIVDNTNEVAHCEKCEQIYIFTFEDKHPVINI